jgi:hypothetical protein
MKPVKTVAERDAEWRRLALEFDYGISNKSFNAAEQVLKITS